MQIDSSTKNKSSRSEEERDYQDYYEKRGLYRIHIEKINKTTNNPGALGYQVKDEEQGIIYDTQWKAGANHDI